MTAPTRPTADDFAAARTLLVELGVPEAARPTAEQLLRFLLFCPKSVALDYMQRMQDTAERASRCWEHGHDEQLDIYRHVCLELRERVRELESQLDWWRAGNV